MAKKKRKKKPSGRAAPGSTVTRKVSRGPGKGDVVKFVANDAGSKHPGKLVPRCVVKDNPPTGTQRSLPKCSEGAMKKRIGKMMRSK